MNRTPCYFHSQPGGCRKGATCRFSHDGPGPSLFGPARSSSNPFDTSPAPPGVCRFYWTRGTCTRGTSCFFKHQAADGSPSASSAGSPTASRPSSPVAFQKPAPPGTCRFFWTTGKCNREFACTFRHESPAASADAEGSWRARATPQAPAFALSIGRGVRRELAPADVQTRLLPFLKEGFTFDSAGKIYTFVHLLSCATPTNKSWTSEDGQLLLEKIASDDRIGLTLLRDILTFADIRGNEVSASAGSYLRKLSFQRGYIKALAYFSSNYVVKSALGHRVNALYGILHHNFSCVARTLRSCMEEAMARRTFDDPAQPMDEQSGHTIFTVIAVTLLEYLMRYKQAVAESSEVGDLVDDVARWAKDWMERVSQTPPTFTDTITSMSKDAVAAQLREIARRLEQIVQIVDREKRRALKAPILPLFQLGAMANEGIIAALHARYIGPGELRPEGPRHDNDFLDVNAIKIAPTHDELVCRVPPFLPANIPGAPHPHPAESMERLMDIQFRLLREELTAPLRVAVQNIFDDLGEAHRRQTQLGRILEKGGGRYRSDSVIFSVYTNAAFVDVRASRRGLAAGVRFDAPPGGARATTNDGRQKFWKASGGKRLIPGGLVALIWKSGTRTTIHLGLVSGSLDELVSSSDGERAVVRVAFFDSATHMRILEELHSGSNADDVKLIIEAPVMYESVRPFLEALRREPATVPFSRYFVHRVEGRMPALEPPVYAADPDFVFNLSSLLRSSSKFADDDLVMNAVDPVSVANARERLHEESFLDGSQSTALVDSLVREVAMIQGPPGTGKSFIGVQLLRVLVASGVRPILLIAFTNHALDHLLEAVLDAGITGVVRLGNRDRTSDRLKQHSLDILERADDVDESRLEKAKRDAFHALKDVQQEIEDVVRKVSQHDATDDDLDEYLEQEWPDHHFSMQSPTPWVKFLFKGAVEEAEQGWRTAGKKSTSVPSLVSFWLAGGDLNFLQTHIEPSRPEHPDEPASHTETPPQPYASTSRFTNRFGILGTSAVSAAVDDEEDVPYIGPDYETYLKDAPETDNIETAWTARPPTRVNDTDVHVSTQDDSSETSESSDEAVVTSGIQRFFESFGISIPELPTSNKPLSALLELDGGLWLLSTQERNTLATFWRREAREMMHRSSIRHFDRLRAKLADSQEKYDELCEQARVRLLDDQNIIGCTTSGAAKLASLMKAISPKVVMVEEAGQVLEAHVLGSLVPSVQHVILVGDPLQLRPNLNNYGLSVESPRGADLYRFDVSAMERLSRHGLPMSRLNVQRRMRSEIADLIRVPCLYPELQDHERVSNYPDVEGVGKNVYFMTHEHKEDGGGDDSTSKHNSFEVAMIVDLVAYLIRQSPQYAKAGSIVVLCAYLGQLVRLRDAISSLFTVVIDERDQSLLEQYEADETDGEEDHTAVEMVQVSQRVLLRTVDNFQGEEADIVILSLVRNSGELADGSRTNIGFLKSINRTNVALSRARLGLYILGNSANLVSHSELWGSVVDKLNENGCIGPKFPLVCPRHPDQGVRWCGQPGDIRAVAPDGGCLYGCQERLRCGHTCPYKCHPDGHEAVVCLKPCQRMCSRQHPCDRLCSQDCASCRFPIPRVELPCGHFADGLRCAQLDALQDVYCHVLVKKQLPNCAHSAMMPCSAEAASWQCREPCGVDNPMCGHLCKARCHQCRIVGEAGVETKHVQHSCGHLLFCRHPCVQPCGSSSEHNCTTDCKYPCRQTCSHATGNEPCGVPCEPCKETCSWICPHHTCPVPCGSPCARLPCDIPCQKLLKCGHPCPSLCGEPCHLQICPRCTTSADADIVDYILQRTLHEVTPSLGTLDELLITLACGHAFTVETLDGHCQLADYYKHDSRNGRWKGLAAPDADFKEPLMCPKCRAPVTSPRYGRASKRADIDVVERNIAGRMSRQVRGLNDQLSKLEISSLRDRIKGILSGLQQRGFGDATLDGKRRLVMQAKHQAYLRRVGMSLVAPATFDSALATVFPFNKAERRAWSQLAHPVLQLYANASAIVATRFAHTAAYEAAFTTLYHAELKALKRPNVRARNPEQYALTAARVKVGQPRPRTDTRFIVEAVWLSVEIRLCLASLARQWLQTVSSDHPNRVEIWSAFCAFIYASAVDDAERAARFASTAEAHRQVLRSQLYILRGRFEEFNFNIAMWQRRRMSADDRCNLITRVQERRGEALRFKNDAVAAYLRTRHGHEDTQWIADNFDGAAVAILEAWEDTEKSLLSGVLYQPVTLEEKLAVARAFTQNGGVFSHVGHFYRCPNGHAYVITECGGAMETSACPECDAPIGGSNHRLDTTNSRDQEMEQLAGRFGGERSPWA